MTETFEQWITSDYYIKNQCFLYMRFYNYLMAYEESLQCSGEPDVDVDSNQHQLNMHQRDFNNYKFYDV